MTCPFSPFDTTENIKCKIYKSDAYTCNADLEGDHAYCGKYNELKNVKPRSIFKMFG